ncbi:amidohydrolase family protein [Desulfitispora alkaliphila]|uniref:amidohydrolase family protein n=1 Tax=Desulfitispora alkaliphila TaxID=622674 RepID=UPI003D1E075E
MFKGMLEYINFSMEGQPLDEIVTDLKKHNVETAVITGRDCETTYQAKSNNKGVIALKNKYPDLFLGFIGLDPHKGMNAVAELNDAVNNEGIRGAAVDPYLAQIYANDARYYPIYSKCCELDVPVIIATGPATLVPNAVIDHVAPRYIDFVARDFPDLKIIISHGAYPWVNEMITVAQRNKNVYVELSEYEFYPQSEAYVQAANTIISDKILFASAHPFVDFRDAIKSYMELDFTEEVREKIMYKNAAKIIHGDNYVEEVEKTASTNAVANSGTEQMIIENVMKELAKRGFLNNG